MASQDLGSGLTETKKEPTTEVQVTTSLITWSAALIIHQSTYALVFGAGYVLPKIAQLLSAILGSESS